MLLYDGIGDTIRVSLSDDPCEEIYTGMEILKALELRKEGTTLVACPSCGRADVDVRALANNVDDLLRSIKSPIKVAVMGCEVNGPGEAKDAGCGHSGGRGACDNLPQRAEGAHRGRSRHARRADGRGAAGGVGDGGGVKRIQFTRHFHPHPNLPPSRGKELLTGL